MRHHFMFIVFSVFRALLQGKSPEHSLYERPGAVTSSGTVGAAHDHWHDDNDVGASHNHLYHGDNHQVCAFAESCCSYFYTTKSSEIGKTAALEVN